MYEYTRRDVHTRSYKSRDNHSKQSLQTRYEFALVAGHSDDGKKAREPVCSARYTLRNNSQRIRSGRRYRYNRMPFEKKKHFRFQRASIYQS